MFALQLRHDLHVKEFYMRAAFNGLRIRSTKDKFDLVQTALSSDTEVAIGMLDKDVRAVTSKQKRTEAVRHLKVVNACMGRKLHAYFAQWLKYQEMHKRVYSGKFKIRVYELYMSILRQGFKQWKDNKTKKMKRRKMKMIQEMESQVAETQNEISVTT